MTEFHLDGVFGNWSRSIRCFWWWVGWRTTPSPWGDGYGPVRKRTNGYQEIGINLNRPRSTHLSHFIHSFLPEIPKSPLDFTDSLHHTPAHQLVGRFRALISTRGWRVVWCSRKLRFERWGFCSSAYRWDAMPPAINIASGITVPKRSSRPRVMLRPRVTPPSQLAMRFRQVTRRRLMGHPPTVPRLRRPLVHRVAPRRVKPFQTRTNGGVRSPSRPPSAVWTGPAGCCVLPWRAGGLPWPWVI